MPNENSAGSDVIGVGDQYYTAQGFDDPLDKDTIIEVFEVISSQYHLYQFIQQDNCQNETADRHYDIVAKRFDS